MIEIIEYDSSYEEQVKDLFIELQEYIEKIDREKYNIVTDDFREKYFERTLEQIKKYDGKDVIVTILDFQFEQQKKQVDLKKYMGRGEKLFQSDAQEAIRELRDYDRL